MIDANDSDDIIRQLVGWAEQRDAIRAVLLTSTRAIPGGAVDVLSDYDVILVAEDIHPFFEDRSWIEDFGDVLVVYWDPIQVEPDHGFEQVGNVTQYQDGLKIDFTVWPLDILQRIAQAAALPAELDAGYRVLLDKDHLTDEMLAPTYSAYIPDRPSNESYQTLVNDFFVGPPYVAKCLWRDELLPAKWCLDYDMRYVYLLVMLEWRMEIDHGWSTPTGNLGKGLKKRLPPEIWSQFEGTFAGGEIDDNWEALFRIMAFFRRVAIEVGESLGFAYPHDLDQQITAYVQRIQRTPRAQPPAEA
jgi:aminoglycoside 6-adenylyltransferase